MSNETAFPTNTELWEPTSGMMLRDYFAAKAMREVGWSNGLDQGAKRAYKIADAMLKARSNHETS